MDDKVFDPRIDEALQNIPLAELPQGFVQSVMEPIRREGKRRVWRFDFNRYAVPVFLVSFVVMIASAGAWVVMQFDQQSLAEVELDISRLIGNLPLPLTAAILASTLICIFVMYSGFLSYFWIVNETG
jgi:hypothetical protein